LAVGWVVLAVVALATAVWCTWTATRLDRLHLRCEATRAVLRSALLQRSAVAVELAAGGLGDPASALVLLEAAHLAREAESADAHQPAGDSAEPQPPSARQLSGSRWLAESDLTAALRVVELPPETTEPLVGELREAARHASMARRIYNDIVATTLDLRGRRRVRWFRLAGHAETPSMVDFDDRVP
jgi:hypothetical protein